MVSAKAGVISTVVSFGPTQTFGSTGFAVNPSGTIFYLIAGSAVFQVSASTGAVSVFAGIPKDAGYSGDGGPATSAMLGANLFSLATDKAGDLFIKDISNYGYIREVNTAGTISTVLSDSCCPIAVAADQAGDIFLAGEGIVLEAQAGTKKRIPVAGDSKSVASGPTVNNSYAVDVAISPGSLTLDPSGNLFFANAYNIIAEVFSIGSTAPATGIATIVSAASSLVAPLAPGSIASAYSPDLANNTESGSTIPLPTWLSGTSVTILDSAGVTTPAPLFYVSPTQVNFYIP